MVRRYDDKGNTIGTPEFTPPKPVRLQWDFDENCQNAIQKSVSIVKDIIEDVDLRIYLHDAYGKGK